MRNRLPADSVAGPARVTSLLAGNLPVLTGMKRRPYWLAPGSESCSGCTFTHVHEVEIRCAACDRGYCVHCVVYVRELLEWLCPECGAESAEEG